MESESYADESMEKPCFEICSRITLNTGIKSLKWCQTMDLLGLVTDDNTFIYYRVSNSNNKVKKISNGDSKISTFCFSPNGNSFILAIQDSQSSQLKLVNNDIGIDSSELIIDENTGKIVFMNWFDFGKKDEFSLVNPFQKKSELNDFLNVIEVHKKSDKKTEKMMSYYNNPPVQFSLMVSANNSGEINFYLNGFMQLLSFDISSLFVFKEKQYKVIDAIFDEDLKNVMVVVKEKNNSKSGNEANLSLKVLDLDFMHAMKDEVISSCYYLSFIENLLDSLQYSINAINEGIKMTISVFNREFYYKYIEKLENREIQDIQPIDDIFNYIKTGQVSQAFEDVLEIFSIKKIADLEKKIRDGFNHQQTIIIESVFPAIERATVILDNLHSKIDSDFKVGRLNIKTKDIESVESLFTYLIKIVQELLFMMTESRDRYTNFFAWLFKIIYRKKNHDEGDRDPPKHALAQQAVDRRTLRKFCSSIKSMKSMFLYTYFMPKMKTDMSEYGFEFFEKEEIDDFNIFKEKIFFENEPKDKFDKGNDKYIESAFEEMHRSFGKIYGIKLGEEEIGGLKFENGKKAKPRTSMVEEVATASGKRLGIKGVMGQLRQALLVIKDKRNEQILKQIYCKKDIDLGHITKKPKQFCKLSYQLADKMSNSKNKMMAFTRNSRNSKRQNLVMIRSKDIESMTTSLQVAMCEIPHTKKLKDLLVTPHNSVVLIVENEGKFGAANIEEVSSDELKWNEIDISGRIEIDFDDILGKKEFFVTEYLTSRELDDPDNEVTGDFGLLHANTKNLFSIANDSRIVIFE